MTSLEGDSSGQGIEAAEVVLPCADIDDTLTFFTQRLGFRVALVFPADAPSSVVIAGHGLRLRLEKSASGPPGVLRLWCRDPSVVAGGARELVAPNGTRVELHASNAPVHLPELLPSFVLTRVDEGAWSSGRAGMLYRDLIPGRQGGRFIASQIRIPAGGPVADYVHYHRVRFQMIYCVAGSVRVVYEDQGLPFQMRAGDAVLQPPGIRHRVLDCSPGLEVIEISCPAEHETHADLAMELPTRRERPERDFDGQRFVHHDAATAPFAPSHPGFETRDLGFGPATGGFAAARVVRHAKAPAAAIEEPPHVDDAALSFTFVLAGSASLDCAGEAPRTVSAGDAFVIPAGRAYGLREASRDFERLEVLVAS